MKTKLISKQRICRQDIKNYQKIDVVGSGCYGCVYRAQNIHTKKIVAIKKLNKRADKKEGIDVCVIRQVSILKKLNHPNIVRFIDLSVVQNQDHAFVVMQYLPSDLQREISSRRQNRLDELANQQDSPKPSSGYGFAYSLSECRQIMKKILEGINFCHQNNIFHRDIKPSNILIHPARQLVKIADFGFAKKFYSNPTLNTQVISSPSYRAPEILLQHRGYGRAVDIWAIGCIFVECLLGKILFESHEPTALGQISSMLGKFGIILKQQCPLSYTNIQSIRDKIFSLPQNPIQKHQTSLMQIQDSAQREQCLDLINKMLQINPENRIRADEALQHPFIVGSEAEKQ